eukprot:3047117-Karenia_brevis.AAC.1
MAPQYTDHFRVQAQYQLFNEVPWWRRLLKWIEEPQPPPFDGGAIKIAPTIIQDQLHCPESGEVVECIKIRNKAW